VTLESALHEATALRFLCTGNAVRSAFAELYARHLGCPLPVDSAATLYRNAELFPETRAALLERGVAARTLERFAPRHLDRLEPDPDPRLLVLGMSLAHLAAWRARFPGHGNAFRLAEVLGRAEDIADPVLEGAAFRPTFERVACCVEALVARLRPGENPSRR